MAYPGQSAYLGARLLSASELNASPEPRASKRIAYGRIRALGIEDATSKTPKLQRHEGFGYPYSSLQQGGFPQEPRCVIAY